jgi:hypothetical protein
MEFRLDLRSVMMEIHLTEMAANLTAHRSKLDGYVQALLTQVQTCAPNEVLDTFKIPRSTQLSV